MGREPEDVWVVDEYMGRWALIQVRYREGPRVRRVFDTQAEAEAARPDRPVRRDNPAERKGIDFWTASDDEW